MVLVYMLTKRGFLLMGSMLPSIAAPWILWDIWKYPGETWESTSHQWSEFRLRLQLSWTFCHGSHPVPGSAPDLLFSRTIMWATVNNNKYINDIVILCHDVIVLFIIKNTQFIIVLFLSLSHYKQTVCNMSRVCWGVRCGDRSDLNVPSCPAAQKKAPEGIQLNPSFLLTD